MNRTTTSPFDIKSATIQGLALVLRSANLGVIEGDLAARVASAGDLFTNAPVLINVTALTADGTAEKLELTRLINLLRRHTMRAVGIVGATGMLLKQAQALGLVEEEDIQPRARHKSPEQEPEPEPAVASAEASAPAPDLPPPPLAETSERLMMGDLFGDTAVEVAPPAPDAALQETAVPAVAAEALVTPTRVIDRPLRSGHRPGCKRTQAIQISSELAPDSRPGQIRAHDHLRPVAAWHPGQGRAGSVEARPLP
jgi:septum formation inhibitor MinC